LFDLALGVSRTIANYSVIDLFLIDYQLNRLQKSLHMRQGNHIVAIPKAAQSSSVQRTQDILLEMLVLSSVEHSVTDDGGADVVKPIEFE
jgi:hypothetical protein